MPDPHHQNDCPRCPVIGAEGVPQEEFFQILSLRFNVTVARKLASDHQLHRVEPRALAKWLEHARTLESHVWHLPPDAGYGVMVTLPSGCGMPLIDGNHRAVRALRLEEPFHAVVLNEEETFQLLRLSMGQDVADRLWQRLRSANPHPGDL